MSTIQLHLYNNDSTYNCKDTVPNNSLISGLCGSVKSEDIYINVKVIINFYYSVGSVVKYNITKLNNIGPQMNGCRC